ncbi:unnamed protein product [Notodromas monacha]|uniref:Ankyrin repeat domain-containing protein n=1 Tax=Notodromas monacha TaxID=399045 RepID=A0A7R9GEM3_9CRUS|nr:unnamed protein product [Notodromas monacha]CAG0918024.1 unnamed protein product [Notodromas monacha]
MYPVHEAVFEGDTKKLTRLLVDGKHDLTEKDKHDAVELLLAHKAPAKLKNAQGWSALAESVSYGDRDLISVVLRALKFQAKEQIAARKPELVRALREMPDFYLELKWDFHSWIPLVSRLLPSDVCKIYKKGATVRLDSTLVDFNDMRWERGDISFIYNGDLDSSEAFMILDNVSKAYQRVRREPCGDETEDEIEEEVDLMMSSDIIMVQMSTKNVVFAKSQTGWIFREDRKESVGKYAAEFYDVNGLVLMAKKRREHLSEADLAKNKAKAELFSKSCNGNSPQPEFDLSCDIPARDSLPPPPPPGFCWADYMKAAEAPRVGRPIVCKESSKSYKATLAMSSEFPLTIETLLNLLEVVAPFKYFSKLRDFVNVKLPPGFPVRVDIPVVPTVTATITFQDFAFRSDFEDSFFTIPSDYVEDPRSWPLGFGGSESGQEFSRRKPNTDRPRKEKSKREFTDRRVRKLKKQQALARSAGRTDGGDGDGGGDLSSLVSAGRTDGGDGDGGGDLSSLV